MKMTFAAGESGGMTMRLIDADVLAPESLVVYRRWIVYKLFERHNCNECIECSECNTWYGHDCYVHTGYLPTFETKMDLEEK